MDKIIFIKFISLILLSFIYMDTRISQNFEEKVNSIIGKALPEIIKQYNINMQIARFTDLAKVESSKVLIEAGLDKDQNDNQSVVFIIDGVKIPQSKKEFEKFTYLFIRTLDPKIENKLFTIVYFVENEVLASGFSRFRDFLKLLPPKYYIRLKQLFAFNASLFIRSTLWFESTKRGKLLNEKISFVGNLDEIFLQPQFHKRWVDFIPDQIKQSTNMTELIKLRNNSLSLNAPQNDVKYVNILGRELSSYTLNEFGIPTILEQLLKYFTRNISSLNEHGIFRKSGSITEERELLDLLSRGSFDALRVITDANLVASVLKKFLAMLATPLFGYKLYDEVTQPNMDQEVQFIQHILSKMQELNRRVLSVMLSFILFVAGFQQSNKMTEYNLSIIFAPCFFRPLESNFKELINIGLIIKFIFMMLKHFNEIYPEISFKLFLGPESQSISSTSSQGVEAQIKMLEEEKQQTKPQFYIEQIIIQSDTIHIQNIGEHILQRKEDSKNEFSITDILDSVKKNKPLQNRKQ